MSDSVARQRVAEYLTGIGQTPDAGNISRALTAASINPGLIPGLSVGGAGEYSVGDPGTQGVRGGLQPGPAPQQVAAPTRRVVSAPTPTPAIGSDVDFLGNTIAPTKPTKPQRGAPAQPQRSNGDTFFPDGMPPSLGAAIAANQPPPLSGEPQVGSTPSPVAPRFAPHRPYTPPEPPTIQVEGTPATSPPPATPDSRTSPGRATRSAPRTPTPVDIQAGDNLTGSQYYGMTGVPFVGGALDLVGPPTTVRRLASSDEMRQAYPKTYRGLAGGTEDLLTSLVTDPRNFGSKLTEPGHFSGDDADKATLIASLVGPSGLLSRGAGLARFMTRRGPGVAPDVPVNEPPRQSVPEVKDTRSPWGEPPAEPPAPAAPAEPTVAQLRERNLRQKLENEYDRLRGGGQQTTSAPPAPRSAPQPTPTRAAPGSSGSPTADAESPTTSNASPPIIMRPTPDTVPLGKIITESGNPQDILYTGRPLRQPPLPPDAVAPVVDVPPVNLDQVLAQSGRTSQTIPGGTPQPTPTIVVRPGTATAEGLAPSEPPVPVDIPPSGETARAAIMYEHTFGRPPTESQLRLYMEWLRSGGKPTGTARP